MASGMQYIVDINTKHRNTPARVSELTIEIAARAKDRRGALIQRGIDALLKGTIHE
jgi:hypothetical protein